MSSKACLNAHFQRNGLASQTRHISRRSRSLRYIAENALRWLGHVARMSLNKLPWRHLTAWVYKPKGIKNEHMLNMRRTYGAPLRVSDQEPYPPSVGEGSAHKGGRVQKRGERQGLLTQHAKDADVDLRGGNLARLSLCRQR